MSALTDLIARLRDHVDCVGAYGCESCKLMDEAADVIEHLYRHALMAGVELRNACHDAWAQGYSHCFDAEYTQTGVSLQDNPYKREETNA